MLIEPLLNEFESQTGIDVEWIYLQMVKKRLSSKNYFRKR